MAVFLDCTNEGKYTHPVKAKEVVALYFDDAEHSCQLHKAGCAHAKKADDVKEYHGALADDWWYVAPCARKA